MEQFYLNYICIITDHPFGVGFVCLNIKTILLFFQKRNK